jgi:hypothetical protein
VLHRLGTRHADAVIRDGDGMCLVVGIDRDAEFSAPARQFRIGQRLETQLIQRVGGVRNQFAEKYFLVAVQGMDHQLQQLLDLGLKAQRLCGARIGHRSCLP